ncbi:glycosyltransferase 87 family protein [Streptomyces sp. NBC_00513]|uniref:glycosyltransferase 87 family protein n=1 Tax=unclassified Streptomyces TaxID=2593676 RepID=UPI002258AAEC|nr:glycosyltransferase 87 family protein [Streptomyces sp. NBC_00424]MCX5072511.1 glycosyltransferase 87 family protein [Streptomyces sp. NBC_00424]WUD44163.1 glycosyltransferase 87 family protein [Streptomyces sp. NBC_00513]
MTPSPTPSPGSWWTAPRMTALWLLAAAWALCFPLFSTLAPHRLWGWCAALGYLGAACLTARRPGAAVAVALTGAVAVPLLWLVLTGQGQSEVAVIERSGRLLLDSGRIYIDRPARVEDYTPYLPGMAAFGIPGVLPGPPGDARLWCAAALFAALWAGRRVVGAEPGGLLPVLVASPVLALPLVVSGVDLPLTGLCCLALAAAVAGRPALAGAALAGACALKWTALPAVAVAVAVLAAARGRRAAVRCALVAVSGTAALVLPSALLQPAQMWGQVFAFPTGRAEVPTPASSPLPGHLLAELGPWGWYLTTGLLVVGALGVAASLVSRPPRTLRAAADRLAIGLTLAFLLAPAGRFGYLALPLVLSLWARSMSLPSRSLVVAGSGRPAGTGPGAPPPTRTGGSPGGGAPGAVRPVRPAGGPVRPGRDGSPPSGPGPAS